MEFAYACGARMYMGKVHGNLHVLLIVLYTKVYGFHVTYHVWCIKVHRKGTWKFACAFNCVVHEGIWIPCALPRVVHKGTYVGKIHGNLHALFHVWRIKIHGKSTWKFPCSFKSVVH